MVLSIASSDENMRLELWFLNLNEQTITDISKIACNVINEREEIKNQMIIYGVSAMIIESVVASKDLLL